KYRANNELSQNDLVDILTLDDDFLSKLDVVTLSRWENEKTSPSLEKKIRIMRKLNLLAPYVYSISSIGVNENIIAKSLKVRFGVEINRYKKINNFKNSNDISFVSSKNRYDLDYKINTFLDIQKNEHFKLIDKWPIFIGCWYSDDNIEAFFIHLYTNNKIFNYGHSDNLSNLYIKNIDGEINSIAVLEQVTSTKDYYKLSTLCLFDTLIKNDNLKYVFFYIRTDFFLKLVQSIVGEKIATVTESDSILNECSDLSFLHIIKIDTINLLSNKNFLSFCLKSYHDLKRNNPTLLNKIYETSIHTETLKK
ncbi:hypothetical protein DAT36_08625, partial [Photobacterium phosphoreum]